jgi:hypothetical protein
MAMSRRTTPIPVSLFDVQRVGPSTGMPTRTQQCDFDAGVAFTVAYAMGCSVNPKNVWSWRPSPSIWLSVCRRRIRHADRDTGMND